MTNVFPMGIEVPTAARTAHDLKLVSDLFHQINRVLPEAQQLLTLPPDMSAREAVAMLHTHSYSQAPVMEGGTVLGVFSFRSFARRAAKCQYEKLDTVPVDSKLLRLQALVMSLPTVGAIQPSICIFSRYRATVVYLKVALEDLGFPVHELRGGMPAEERAAAIHVFREQGGVLVASPVLATEGIDLPNCNSLILYDMPISTDQMEQLYGRFQRFGRVSGLNVYAFAPIRAFGPLTLRAVQTSDLEALFSDEH